MTVLYLIVRYIGIIYAGYVWKAKIGVHEHTECVCSRTLFVASDQQHTVAVQIIPLQDSGCLIMYCALYWTTWVLIAILGGELRSFNTSVIFDLTEMSCKSS
ncbi:hypothetical protein BDR03DRAFT_963047 [Suillus americanus]|nr:hypothetical protein BDR03DRAFT_963047 [Suillus americanus]